MRFKEFFDKWGLNNIKLSMPFAQVELEFTMYDEEAAWEMYVELITRVTTQELDLDTGDEAAALKSVYELFGLTRGILKKYGRKGRTFTKIAVIVLNQIIRPFTSKWHQLSLSGAFSTLSDRAKFREELAVLQIFLKKYSGMLAEIAQVEDLTSLL